MTVPTFTNLGVSANPDIESTANASSYSNTSSTPPTSGLAVAFVANTKDATITNSATMSGWGITWVPIVERDPGGTIQNRLRLFGADLAGSSAGILTVDFAGEVMTACMLSLIQATGVDLTGGVAAAFVQSPTNAGTALLTLEVALAAAGHADNRPVAGFFHRGNEGSTERANWTEADDLFGATPVHDLETQWRADNFETTASASWATSATCIGIAAEIKGAQAVGPPPPHMTGRVVIPVRYGKKLYTPASRM